MSSYDQQYQTETALFGAPYPEFTEFVTAHAKMGGAALDLGCGQGRDALMLASVGYRVTGVDGSRVGVEQMVAEAQRLGLDVTGVVGDMYRFSAETPYDLIVLDSMLHFGKEERVNELALLDRLVPMLNRDGLLCLFIHKNAAKEKILNGWIAKQGDAFEAICQRYVDYTYEEKASGFKSAFQYYMVVLRLG